MKKFKVIILLVVILMITFSSIVLAGFWKDKSYVSQVDFEGNTTLTKEEVFQFCKLNDSLITSNTLSLEVIETRISKHPNVKSVKASKDGNIIKIEVSEKNPIALVSNGEKLFLADDKLSIYNLKKEHVNLDLPVITGLSKTLEVGSVLNEDYSNLNIAKYIISKSFKLSRNLFKQISEINFADVNSIKIHLTDDACVVFLLDYPKTISSFENNTEKSIKNQNLRKEIDLKLLLLNNYLQQVKVYKGSSSVTSVDLRYNNVAILNYKKIVSDKN